MMEKLKMKIRKYRLNDARKIEPDFEVGEDVSEEVKLADLRTKSNFSLKTKFISKIHEHDSTNVFKYFEDLNRRNIYR